MLKNFCVAACAAVLLAGLAGLAGGCDDDKGGGGSGGGGAAAGPNLSTPKDAATSFVQAMQNGDAAGVKATTVNGTDADYKNLASVGNAMKAFQSFKTEANAKFGADAAGLTEQIPDMPDLAADLAGREAKIEGDTARLVKPGETVSAEDDVQLKKDGDSWKVDLATMPNKAEMAERSGQMEKMAKVVNEVTADIKGGKIKTVQEAQTELGKKMMALMAPEGGTPPEIPGLPGGLVPPGDDNP